MSVFSDLDLESVEAFLKQTDNQIRKKSKPSKSVNKPEKPEKQEKPEKIQKEKREKSNKPEKKDSQNHKYHKISSPHQKKHKKHKRSRSRSKSIKKSHHKESKPHNKPLPTPPKDEDSFEKFNEKLPPKILNQAQLREIEEKMEQKIKEAEEAKRDDLTVLVLQLPLKASEIDVYQFFSDNNCGKIRDIRIIKDPKNGKSKGVAYVEFYSEESKFKALAQSGKIIVGNAVKIQPSQAEKNRAHAVAKQNKIVRPYLGAEIAPIERPNDTAREINRIYIEGLAGGLSDIQEIDLKELFSPFGEIEFLDLRRDPKTLKCKGFAMIQYKNTRDARAALEMMNGFEINNQRISVSQTPTSSMLGLGAGNNGSGEMLGSIERDLDIEDTSSFLHSAQSRYLLMQKLTREGNLDTGGMGVIANSFEEKSNNSEVSSNFLASLDNTVIQTAQGPKKIIPEANVFVKNIDPTLTIGMFESVFSMYGSILSCKIATDPLGNPLGYGYVQFENKEAADLAIAQANNTKLKNNVIQVQPFISKINRLDAKNNLYIKNLPNNIKDDDLNKKLIEVFGVFGPITSSTVKFDSNIGRPYGFICFENHMNAELAFRNMQGADPFNIGTGLYIGWAEKKPERVKRLTELYSKNMMDSLMGLGYKL